MTISYLVSDLVFAWRLRPLDDRAAIEISVHVDLPAAESHRLDAAMATRARS